MQFFNKIMGRCSSTPQVPVPVPLLDEPWRRIEWGGKQQLLRQVKEFKPLIDEAHHVRVLLYGPVGVGKSSFVNSVCTVVRGRADIQATPNASVAEGRSFTKEYKTHRIRKEGPKSYYPYVFNDVMGLEGGDGIGVRADDIILAMKGHVRDGYKFNPVSPLTESNTQFYNPNPTVDDKVHLLVCMLSANAPDINPSVLQKMKEIREAARDLGIPQVAVATHIDLMCKEVKQDVKNVFKSKYLKQKMEEFSTTVGIPMNCIFPVKNYSAQVDNEDDMDTLVLNAFKHMLNFADDFLDTL